MRGIDSRFRRAIDCGLSRVLGTDEAQHAGYEGPERKHPPKLGRHYTWTWFDTFAVIYFLILVEQAMTWPGTYLRLFVVEVALQLGVVEQAKIYCAAMHAYSSLCYGGVKYPARGA